MSPLEAWRTDLVHLQLSPMRYRQVEEKFAVAKPEGSQGRRYRLAGRGHVVVDRVFRWICGSGFPLRGTTGAVALCVGALGCDRECNVHFAARSEGWRVFIAASHRRFPRLNGSGMSLNSIPH